MSGFVVEEFSLGWGEKVKKGARAFKIEQVLANLNEYLKLVIV